MARGTRVRAALGVVLAAAALAAGCGDDEDDNGTSASEGAGTGAAAGVETARKELEAAQEVPGFKPPGPAFDARKAVDGMTLMSIPASSSVPFVQTLQDGVEALAPDVGLKFLDWPNQGMPVQWVQGMNAGIDRKVAAINLMAGINPASLGPQVAQAGKAGIPVLASHLYDTAETPPEGVDSLPISYEKAGRLLADWVVVKTEGEANTLVVKIDEVPSTKPMMKGITEVFDSACPDSCKTTTINVAIADVATKIQPQVQSALTKDPGINYVIALYDSAEAPFVVAAIRAAGASDRVKVVTFNGTPSVLKLVKSGEVEMDVAEQLDWTSYAILDQAMRLMAGLPPVKDPQIPLRIFDQGNVDEAGNNPATAEGFGEEYKQGYRKLWGLGG